MLLNFQWKKIIKKKKKKIERSIEHFTFYFTLSYFHENSIYTAFERAHCTGKGSTLRLRLFFSDIQILSMGSLRLNFLIDIVNLKPKKLLEPYSSKHLRTIINGTRILPRYQYIYIFFPRWFSIFLLSFRGVDSNCDEWKINYPWLGSFFRDGEITVENHSKFQTVESREREKKKKRKLKPKETVCNVKLI